MDVCRMLLRKVTGGQIDSVKVDCGRNLLGELLEPDTYFCSMHACQ